MFYTWQGDVLLSTDSNTTYFSITLVGWFLLVVPTKAILFRCAVLCGVPLFFIYWNANGSYRSLELVWVFIFFFGCVIYVETFGIQMELFTIYWQIHNHTHTYRLLLLTHQINQMLQSVFCDWWADRTFLHVILGIWEGNNYIRIRTHVYAFSPLTLCAVYGIFVSHPSVIVIVIFFRRSGGVRWSCSWCDDFIGRSFLLVDVQIKSTTFRPRQTDEVSKQHECATNCRYFASTQSLCDVRDHLNVFAQNTQLQIFFFFVFLCALLCRALALLRVAFSHAVTVAGQYLMLWPIVDLNCLLKLAATICGLLT